MQNINQKKYEQYVKQLTPTHSLPLNMAKAFLTGGLICLLGQVILNTAQALGADASDSRTWCSVILILLSVLWYLSQNRQIRRCRKSCSHYRIRQLSGCIRH